MPSPLKCGTYCGRWGLRRPHEHQDDRLAERQLEGNLRFVGQVVVVRRYWALVVATSILYAACGGRSHGQHDAGGTGGRGGTSAGASAGGGRSGRDGDAGAASE